MVTIGVAFTVGILLGAAVAWAVRSEMAGRAVASAQRDAFNRARSQTPEELERWREADLPPKPPAPPPPDPRPWEKHADYEGLVVDTETEPGLVLVFDDGSDAGFRQLRERVDEQSWRERWGLET